ncbi:competence protein CoiA [Planctomycetes bacterium K23_9]|uniref:Competence protein CoiA nuclease-like domain-containing protein n=1 Tax=Stieleria marina TaxID=1930275 RepID=A0A517NU80_9BACT|nr:hypothetical protein K239x_26420 [Planctomycetes bacterium K23_9]
MFSMYIFVILRSSVFTNFEPHKLSEGNVPLKALYDDKTVIAPLLCDQEWDTLRRDLRDHTLTLRLPCCGAECFARESKLGTRHFYHARGAECSSPRETLEHLLAKERIILGGHDAGFQVEAEAIGEGWRADVLARKGKVEIAFEVQWSSQTLDETHSRQERYKKDGIRCAWLFRRLPKNSRPARDLPMFKIDFKDRADPIVEGQPLRKFAKDLLSGRYKFCERTLVASEQELIIQILPTVCWKCKQNCHVFRVVNQAMGLLSTHQEPIAYLDDGFDEGVDFCKEAVRFIRELRSQKSDIQFFFGEVKNRYSRTKRRSYLSQGCPFCDALFGDHYLHHDGDLLSTEPILEHKLVVAVLKRPIVEKAHWCFSETMQFCC